MPSEALRVSAEQAGVLEGSGRGRHSRDAAERARAVLRDVIRSGGRDTWPHLSSHGHSFSTVMKCVRLGWLSYDQGNRYRYEITSVGEQWVGKVAPATLAAADG